MGTKSNMLLAALLAALAYSSKARAQEAPEPGERAIKASDSLEGKLAFLSEEGGIVSVCTSNSDGSGREKLVGLEDFPANHLEDAKLCWSLDGKYIAIKFPCPVTVGLSYASWGSRYNDLWVIKSKELVRLTHDQDPNRKGRRGRFLTLNGAWSIHPSNYNRFVGWSPDSKTAYVVKSLYGERDSVWAIDVETRKEREIKELEGMGVLAVSSNGLLLCQKRISNRNLDIAAYNDNKSASGPRLITLTNSPTDDDLPNPSPNGKEVAFLSRRNATIGPDLVNGWLASETNQAKYADVYVVNLDTGCIRRVTKQKGHKLIGDWLFDNVLLYQVYDGPNPGYYWIRTDGLRAIGKRIDVPGSVTAWNGESLFSGMNGALYRSPLNKENQPITAVRITTPKKREYAAALRRR